MVPPGDAIPNTDATHQVVVLYRSWLQRFLAAPMVLFTVSFSALLLVGLATVTLDNRWSASIATLIVGAVFIPIFAPVARVCYRVVRMPRATIELGPDRLVVTDWSLFYEPLVIERTRVVDVEPPPATSYRSSKGPRKANETALTRVGLSLLPERANCLLVLTEPIVLSGVRRNLVRDRWGTYSWYVVRPPTDGGSVSSFLIRTESPEGT